MEARVFWFLILEGLNGFQDEFSMKKNNSFIEKVLGKKVLLSNDVIGEDSILKASNLNLEKFYY